MSESLQDSKKPTDHHTKPLGQQKLQSPQRPRPSGHHSHAPLSLSFFLSVHVIFGNATQGIQCCQVVPSGVAKLQMKFQKKEGTQKVEFFGTSNFGSDMRLSPRIR